MNGRPKLDRSFWPSFGVVAATLIVFSRSLTGGFLEYDDVMNLVANPHFQGLNWANLRWMFGLNWAHWYPLTWLSYTADHALWGLNPAGYHLTNVLLHALNAGLAFRLFDRLMGKNGARDDPARRAAAAFGALFFALHPLRVESVTWLSERSDVLSATFSLGTALAWIEERSFPALLLHAAALASKSVSMAVPAALGLLDALGLSGRRWPGARREARDLAPMLALSAAAGAANVWSQAREGDLASLGKLSFDERLAIGAWSYAHGLAKTLWPAGLEGIYPMPHPFDAAEPRFLLAGALVVLLSVLAWRLRRRAPALAAAWGAYILIMAPTAGFIKIGIQLIADRYTYLAGLGGAGLAGEAVRRVLARRWRAPAAAAAVTCVIALAGLTWARQGDWLDSDRFWSAMMEEDADNALARFGMAQHRMRERRPAEAEALLRDAVAIDPSLGQAQNALANLLVDTGRVGEAIPLYESMIAAFPSQPAVRYNFALALASLGRRAEAAQLLRDELALIANIPRRDPRSALGLKPDEARTRSLLDSLSRLPNPGGRRLTSQLR